MFDDPVAAIANLFLGLFNFIMDVVGASAHAAADASADATDTAPAKAIFAASNTATPATAARMADF